MAEALKWSLKAFREAFREVSQEGMVKADWEARIIWIPKAIHFNRPDNPNVIIGWQSTWDELPESQLKSEAYQYIKDFLKPFSEGFLKAFEKCCLNRYTNSMPNQEQEQEQEQKQEQEQDKEGKSSGDQPPPPTVQGIMDQWNGIPGVIQAPKKFMNGDNPLASLVRRRIKQHPNQEWWDELVEAVGKSDFLTGKTEGRDGRNPFVADLLWVLGPQNLIKVLMGKFTNRGSGAKKAW